MNRGDKIAHELSMVAIVAGLITLVIIALVRGALE